MKRFFTILLFWLLAISAYCQKMDYTWLLGYEPGGGFDPDSNIGFSHIQFDEGIPQSYYLNGSGSMLLTNASISHPETGELLAYTDGCRIFNRQFEQMINGDSINFGKTWSQYCTNFFGVTYYPSINTALFLPRPGHPDEVYLIHAKDTITKQSTYWMDKIYASTISFKTFPNGFVKKKNKLIFTGQIKECEMHAVKHANGMDWWLFFPQYQTNSYFKFLVQADTVLLFDTQAIGPIVPFGGGTVLKFSPDGTKLARFSREQGILLWDFDRQTGMLSNTRQWLIPDSTHTFIACGEFSPDSRFIYIDNTWHLWQVDTWESDLQEGATLIADYDGFLWNDFFSTGFQFMVIGPDCKIYMSTNGTTPFLHVIHHPDLPGTACGFEQRGVKLPATNGKCLPNMVNYRLDTGPVCDSTLSTSFFLPVKAEVRLLEVRPNPARGQFQVTLPDFGSGGTLTVIDIAGREVAHLPWTGETMNVICTGWTPGLFFLNLYDPQGRYASGRVMVE